MGRADMGDIKLGKKKLTFNKSIKVQLRASRSIYHFTSETDKYSQTISTHFPWVFLRNSGSRRKNRGEEP